MAGSGARGFLDRRREFREAVEAGVAVIGGRVFPLVNWSRTGFLAAGWDGASAPGDVVEVDLSLLAAGRRHEFRALAAIVRVDAGARVAARFVSMDAAVRAAVDRHFDPAAALREAVGGRTYSEMTVPGPAVAGAGGRDLPVAAGGEAATVVLPPGLRRLGPDQRAAVSDLLFAVKVAFARRCHPDAVPADRDRDARARVFAEFWAEIGRIEKALSGPPG